MANKIIFKTTPVLPTVYEDSLSYGELVGKCVSVVNELSDDVEDLGDEVDEKSTVSVSATGTATSEVQYITIDGVEKKLAGGDNATWGSIEGTLSNQTDLQTALNGKSTVSVSATGSATDTINYITVDGVQKKIAGLNNPSISGSLAGTTFNDLTSIDLGFFKGTEYSWNGGTSGRDSITVSNNTYYKISDDKPIDETSWFLGKIITSSYQEYYTLLLEDISEEGIDGAYSVSSVGGTTPLCLILTQAYGNASAGLYALKSATWMSHIYYGEFHKINSKYLDVDNECISTSSSNVYKTLIANGDGTVSWGKITNNSITSESAANGAVLTADGTGLCSWQSLTSILNRITELETKVAALEGNA